MIEAIVSHETALWLLTLLAAESRRPSIPTARVPNVSSESPQLAPIPLGSEQRAKALVETYQPKLGVAGFEYPIDMTFPGRAARRRSKHIRAHSLTCRLPAQSCICLDDRLPVSGPELCFLQMAERLSTLELAQLGFEMCGRYLQADAGYGFVRHLPLTTVDRIKAMLAAMPPDTRCLGKAKRAASWVLDGSRSPMETRTALLLTLDRRLGGYGLDRPQMNVRIDLSEDAAAMAATPYYVVDLLWQPIRYAIEYNGADFHADVMRDSRRHLALLHDGMTVAELTSEQVMNQTQLADVVREIQKKEGLRTRRPSEQMLASRERLLAELFPPKEPLPSGRIGFPAPPWALPASLAQGLAAEGMPAA
jgi:hypothetical protein